MMISLEQLIKDVRILQKHLGMFDIVHRFVFRFPSGVLNVENKTSASASPSSQLSLTAQSLQQRIALDCQFF